MNLGMTLSVGVYGIGGAFFSELIKDQTERNGTMLAVELIGWLAFFAATTECLLRAHKKIDSNRE